MIESRLHAELDLCRYGMKTIQCRLVLPAYQQCQEVHRIVYTIELVMEHNYTSSIGVGFSLKDIPALDGCECLL